MDDADLELRRRLDAEALCQAPTIVGAREVLARATARPTWLVPELVPAGDLVLVTGAPGAKKSWLAYSLAVAVAKATEAQSAQWLGVSIAADARRTRGQVEALVLNYDNSTGECGRRFLRLGLKAGDPVRFHSLDVGAPLRLPDAADSLATIADYLSPRVILVDSLRQAHTAEENSSKEMMAVMGALKRLYACGATVVVVHHSGKAVGAVSKSRGSEEIDASATAVIHVGAERDGISSAHWAKHRSWDMPAAKELRHFRVTDYGETTRVEHSDPPKKKERRTEGDPR